MGEIQAPVGWRASPDSSAEDRKTAKGGIGGGPLPIPQHPGYYQNLAMSQNTKGRWYLYVGDKDEDGVLWYEYTFECDQDAQPAFPAVFSQASPLGVSWKAIAIGAGAVAFGLGLVWLLKKRRR